MEGNEGLAGIAQNVTVMPKTTLAQDSGLGRSERFVSIRETGPLADTLAKNGFTEREIQLVLSTLRNVRPSLNVQKGAKLRILFGPSRDADILIPYRMSIYDPDPRDGAPRHSATAALTDTGTYVLGFAPTDVAFPE